MSISENKLKSILVVLLILAVAGGVFAQDITWSGEVKTGAKVTLGDSAKNAANEKTTMIQADEDDVPTGVKARLNAEVAGDNYGVQFGLSADMRDGAPSQLVKLYNAHGWLDFVNGMIKVRAGLIDPKVWNTKGPKDWNISSGLGFRLEVSPIEGLNVGALLNYDGAANGIAKTSMEIGDFFKETAFGFSYENADIMGLYANAAFKLDSEADNTRFTGTPNGRPEADAFSTLIFGFGLTPMEALAVKVEGKIEGLTGYGDAGWMWFVEDVSYQVMEPLKVGLRMDQQVADKEVAANIKTINDNTDTSDKDDLGDRVKDFAGYKMYLEFKPYAEYVVSDAIKVGAEIPFALADGGAKDELGFMKIGAKVYGQYNVAANAWLNASYAFTNVFKDYAGGNKSTLDHTIRLIAGVAF